MNLTNLVKPVTLFLNPIFVITLIGEAGHLRLVLRASPIQAPLPGTAPLNLHR